MCFVAIYSVFGFLDWYFYHGTGVDHEKIKSFLIRCLRPFFVKGNLVVLDNASNNKHADCIKVLDEITDGNYIFNAPYWHYYAPIERGSSNVLREARSREDEAMVSPTIILNESFIKYSVIGSHGYVGT
jgi:hypothetical protein